ncbi:MAG: hypothetical protein JXR52_12740 [Bacteroidales bacterium]|nr:hypothetical protein [Bacteroidales bacterium]
MNEEHLYNKTTLTRVIISKVLDGKNPDTIKATHVPGYENPERVTDTEGRSGYVPDIIASINNQTYIYEIELQKKEMPVDKWKLFSDYAQERNGKLVLLVPDYIRQDVKKKLNNSRIDAGLIYFETA